MGPKNNKKPQDIYSLNFDKIKKIGWVSELSANNLKLSIDKSKKVTLERFIYAIGIRHIGIENAKLISENIKTISNFTEIIKKKILKNF